MATNKVPRTRVVQVVIPALACVLLVMLLVVLPEIQVTLHLQLKSVTNKKELTLNIVNGKTDGSTPTCEGVGNFSETLQTCNGRRLEGGYVLALKNWEQQTAGSANLMSLQCWAATLNLVVVEYFMHTSVYGVPNELLANSSTASPNRFVRLRQLYDIDYWNQYSRSKCYAPLVKWEEFLCNAPREVILVHIAYELQGCPTQYNYKKSFTDRLSPFVNAHGFKIHREVCLEGNREHTKSTLKSLLLGNVTSKVTVVLNLWRGIANNPNRVSVTDTGCNRNKFLPLQFARPSTELLEQVRLYREQVLGNKDYLAVMVRLELAVRALHRKRAWSPSQCMKGISIIWRDLKKRNNLEQTFWSFDVGTYGSVGYSKGAAGGYKYVSSKLFSYLQEYHNVSYPAVEESLVNISGTHNAGYNAALQMNIAMRAKCLLLIGGGSFQTTANSVFRSLHKGTPCVVKKEIGWLKQQCIS